MGNKFSYRPNFLARKKLIEAQQLFKIHGKKFSINQIINLIVVGKLKNYHLPKSLSVNQLNKKFKRSEKDREKLSRSFIRLANALNNEKRNFDEGYNNLNQLTKKVNEHQISLDPIDLKQYKQMMIQSSKRIKELEEVSTKLWQRM